MDHKQSSPIATSQKQGYTSAVGVTKGTHAQIPYKAHDWTLMLQTDK